MSDTLTVSAGQHSIAGRKAVNEDSCGIRIPDNYLLETKGVSAIIADGVSTASGGREAGEACVQGFLQDYYSTPESWSTRTSVQKVLGSLNRWLYGRSLRHHGRDPGFVTTLSALVIKSTTAYLFHIGDTRIYRWREGELEQLTTDHCIARGGEKTFLNRAMGVQARLEIDYLTTPVEPGDVFVLTTDGVHEFIDHRSLTALVAEGRTAPESFAHRVATTALEAGSHDNVSCQLIRIDTIPFYEDEDAFYRKLTELPFPPPLSTGQIIDGFRVVRELHASKRTYVYLAQDTETGDNVTLKCPSTRYADDADYIDGFLHEEWVGQRINSPHVLKVLPHPRKRRFLYCLTEHCEGQTLRQWMHDRGGASLTEVRDLVNQLMHGLLAFHRLEMVHRDIKPENVLLDRNGTARIIDFGSVKIAGIDEIARPLSRTGEAMGTYNYSAPELMNGEPSDSRGDLFSVGVIAYELLTGGHLPYGEIASSGKLRRAIYQSSRRHNPDIPAWVDGALQKAVNKQVSQRYSLLSEFVYDLSNPNAEFTTTDFKPLIQRNPVLFWQLLSVCSIAANTVLLYFLNR